jgi:hypothetical protein
MKASPNNLGLKPFRKIERTFSDWTDHQFHCSCGIRFDGEFPERDPNTLEECPGLDPNAEDQEAEKAKHEVTLQPANLAFKMDFKILGQTEVFGTADFISELEVKYATGLGIKGEPGYRSPLPLPPVNGKIIKPNRMTCGVAAFLVSAQLAPNGVEADLYTAEELFGFMLSDSMCQQMYRTYYDVQTGGEHESPLVRTQVA